MKNTEKNDKKSGSIELVRFDDSYVDDWGGVHYDSEFRIVSGRTILATFPYEWNDMDAQYKAAKLIFNYYINEEKELASIQELRPLRKETENIHELKI